MRKKRILILGGYGTTGAILTRLILQNTDAAIVIAGRNREKAVETAGEMNKSYQGNRATGIQADAADMASLKEAFGSIDIAIIASSTSQYVANVVETCLSAGADYFDIQYSAHKIEVLNSYKERIKTAGRIFITDGGFHPGLPAAMVHYTARYFDELTKANIGSIIKLNWSNVTNSESTVYELLDEFKNFNPLYYNNGKWKKAKLSSNADQIKMDFGEYGIQQCVPMYLEEMKSLPEIYPALTDTGFFVGGFNWFVDYLVMPIAMLSLAIAPKISMKPIGSLFSWGLKKFSRPPFVTMLKLEACGEKNGTPKKVEMSISHEDGYVITAVPVVACLRQYLQGTIKKPGLYFQAHCIEPTQFMKDIEQMGASVQIFEKQ